MSSLLDRVMARRGGEKREVLGGRGQGAGGAAGEAGGDTATSAAGTAASPGFHSLFGSPTCASPKPGPGAKYLICRHRSGENPRSMIALATPPDSALPLPRRGPPPACPREPGFAPTALHLQANGDSAQASYDGPAFLGRTGQGLGRVEAAPRDRDPGHRPAVAAASLSRVLDPALWPHDRRSPARQRRDPGSRHPHGNCQPPLGRAAHPWRAPQARHRRGRAHRLPADADAAAHTVSDLGDVPCQPRPRPGLHRFLYRAHRPLARPVRPRRARSPSPARCPLQRNQHPTATGPLSRL